MYLEQKVKNTFTIGKLLRNTKGVRRKDTTARKVEMPKDLQQYTDHLIAQGMKIKGVAFAIFKTKNGLEYPGLIATETIPANRILVRVPRQSLLTTRHAFLSDIQKVFEQNADFFAKRFTSDWEDHLLLAFLLYEYQKGKESRWYHLIHNLPREIDFVIFWEPKEIQAMQDTFLSLKIKNQRLKFDKQCIELAEICKKYPLFFNEGTATLENIQWIYTHLVTRCFGKYFQYTTMVPFAELFNHECIDVYYSMDYKPDNPHTENEQFYEQQTLTQQEIDERDTSDGTYSAQDFYESDEEFKAQKPLSDQVHFSINEEIAKEIKSIVSYVITFISFNDSVSLPFLAQTFKRIQELQNSQEDQIAVRSQLQKMHQQNVAYLKLVKQFYHRNGSRAYVYGLRQKKKPMIQKPVDKAEEGENYFPGSWPVDKFDDFLMLCSTKDQFEEGSQVYFCYGRLPNKLLLLRYGIALEYNKYDHLFIRLDVGPLVLQNMALLSIVDKEVSLCKYKRFKVKRTKMCIELITFIRAMSWKYGESLQGIFFVRNLPLQVQVLEEAKDIYLRELQKFSKDLKSNEQLLQSKDLGYHDYFGLVYKVEQQRILNDQIRMIEYAMEIMKGLGKKQSLSIKECLVQQKRQEYFTLQIMMENYFKCFH